MLRISEDAFSGFNELPFVSSSEHGCGWHALSPHCLPGTNAPAAASTIAGKVHMKLEPKRLSFASVTAIPQDLMEKSVIGLVTLRTTKEIGTPALTTTPENKTVRKRVRDFRKHAAAAEADESKQCPSASHSDDEIPGNP